MRVGKLAGQRQALDNFLTSSNLSRELELLSCDLRSPDDHRPKWLSSFMHHEQLRKLVEEKRQMY